MYMMPCDNDSDTNEPSVYGVFFLNGWFVRMICKDRVLLIETTPNSSLAAPSGRLVDFVPQFVTGQHFPHHLSRESGLTCITIFTWQRFAAWSASRPALCHTLPRRSPLWICLARSRST